MNLIHLLKISVDHNIYDKVECYERHQLIPFSNNGSGVITQSRISLTLNEEDTNSRNEADSELIIKRSSLLFDHTPSLKEPHEEIRTSRELLKKMCNLGFPDIRRGFPDAFTNFLTTAKLLSFKALQEIFSRSDSICTSGKYDETNSYRDQRLKRIKTLPLL